MNLQTLISDFHFLRPWWLLAIVPACLLAWTFWRQKSSAANWHGAIDSRLLEHLIDGGSTRSARWPWLLLFCSWLLAALAMAGPSWQQLPQPVLQKKDALVIVLDLSLSMLAEDIKPSRLVRARHKVLDLLNTRQEGLTGLIAYAGDAHIVSPLTDDNATIANLVPALSPEMMPAAGSDPVSALQLAEQSLQNAGMTSGRVLLITDGVTAANVRTIDKQLLRSGYQLAILGVGTGDGAPIPTPEGFLKDRSGNIAVPQLKRSPLEQLAKLNNGRYTDISLNDNDLQFLLSSPVADLNDSTVATDRQFDQWQDRGPLLALLLLPLALLGFRRGWLLLLPLALLLQPQPSYAFEWQDLWQTPDQRASKAWQQGDSKSAAEQFKNPDWQGSAHYQSGNYQQAVDSFAQTDSADAHYNRGNALAKAGQLEQAIDAYEQALQRQPDMQDAQANKQLLEQLKQQQEQQQPSDSQDSEQQDSDQQNSEQQDSEQQNSDQQSADQQSSEPQDSEQQDTDQQNGQQPSEPQKPQPDAAPGEEQVPADPQPQPSNEEQQTAAQDPSDQATDQPPETTADTAATEQESQQQTEQQQAMEQWLRKIPDDPSGLLRRKFNYQHRLRQQRGVPVEESPQW